MKWLVIILGLVLLSLTAIAEDTPTITVIGEGKVTVPADTIFVSVGVDYIADNATEADLKSSEKLNSTIEALIGAGVKRENVLPGISSSTQNTRIYKEIYNNTTCEVVEYNVTNLITKQITIQLRTEDESTLNAILEAAKSQGVRATISGYKLNDTGPALTQARKLALEDAGKKAEEWAYFAGLKIGGIVEITELAYPQMFSFSGTASDISWRSAGALEWLSSQMQSLFGMEPTTQGMVDVTSCVVVTYEVSR